ncbi:hypothetical protein [Hymenobacter perfusus]|uniref:Lipoprotein n=1 Tax=Hymenobacter perfusus TaxID=1236770 RepID=A0A3R9MDH8_9BACT|nr:hypothetical protein [Hymenobacter perfusus]RSK39485.1 hypothetical protein EI293_19895 [Hymenobacter perfusus]
MFRIFLLLPLLLAACSSPAVSQSPYPQNPAVSDAQGHPRDSGTFYFPRADSVSKPDLTANQLNIEEQNTQATYCQLVFGSASANLYCFGAPVLSNYYLGHDTYRFLWLRAFHQPVLLTLTQQANGATLQTQFLTKSASAPRLALILFIPPTASPDEAARLQREFDLKQKDPKVLRELAERNRPAERLPQLETTHVLTPQQWQQFLHLVQQSGFHQQTSCEISTVMDGAGWLLEAHTAGGYHAVYRHSPDKPDSFRRACEYLLDLSSARKEDRY